MIDSKNIRKDFPQLDGEGYHYLDAAASSLTPQSVLDTEIDYYTHSRANVHRGLFHEAVNATELYEGARRKVANFLHVSTEEVIFTSGATEASNMLIRMIEESVTHTEEQKELVTSVMEHHASIIPLQQFSFRKGVPLHVIPMRGVGLDYEKAEEIITDKTALVSVMLASNATGGINDVRRIADIAHRHGAIMVVDATAAMGHIPVDVESLGCDALYFSGHKMLAPTGIGALWVKYELLEKLTPSIFGGHMISHVDEQTSAWASIPSRFEAGTKNISGAIGLGAAIDYLEKVGIENIRTHVEGLVAYAIAEISKIDGVKIVSDHNIANNVGIVSFSCDFAHPHDIAEILARDRVAVRQGHHCAIPLHTALGISSTTRASFHLYNTKVDIDALVVSLKKARVIFT